MSRRRRSTQPLNNSSILAAQRPFNPAKSLQIRIATCRFQLRGDCLSMRRLRATALLAVLAAIDLFGDVNMWCTTCHQDVPGVAHAKSGRTVCSRCQQPLLVENPAHASKIRDDGLALDEPVAVLAAAAPPVGDYDWQSREQVRRLVRQLRRPTMHESRGPIPAFNTSRRLDPPQNLGSLLVADAAPAFAPISDGLAPATNRKRRAEAGQVVAWLIVIVGALALAGGLGLIGWSLSNAEMRYWNEALGLTLGGQGILIFGLVLVVTRLWRNSRYASNRLQDVHARLAQLQRTADAISAMRSGGAPAFYADLVRGASPQVLLANLKGQLDQLATRLGSGW
jgi:hypothetical protein